MFSLFGCDQEYELNNTKYYNDAINDIIKFNSNETSTDVFVPVFEERNDSYVYFDKEGFDKYEGNKITQDLFEYMTLYEKTLIYLMRMM